MYWRFYGVEELERLVVPTYKKQLRLCKLNLSGRNINVIELIIIYLAIDVAIMAPSCVGITQCNVQVNTTRLGQR